MSHPWIEPAWPAPARVQAVSTTRRCGVSAGPYASLNLGGNTADSEQAVARNRRSLIRNAGLPREVFWLRQVHGTRVVAAHDAPPEPEADAVWTDRVGQPLGVLTADCLPVLLCDREGTRVAAVHAGWRGLALLALVAFVGWVVLRYARVYLDGEDGQGAFTGWLCSTLAMVLLLVQAGHLVIFAAAWIGTSLCLHHLLLFYPKRAAAVRGARKKFVVARAGDAAVLVAFGLLFWWFGTGDIAALNAAAAAGAGSGVIVVAAGGLAVAALLKSAQFPTHGWLTEVMETPTPVSALLHAGVVNAGGFLLIRFADVMLLAPGILAVLVMIGGFTALFACLVMLAQPAVKTSLAWSTIGQMGFMILQCGLALFPLALLHILAHSLYKAHAFLASGGAVERVAAIHRPGPVAVPRGAAVGRAFLAALARARGADCVKRTRSPTSRTQGCTNTPLLGLRRPASSPAIRFWGTNPLRVFHRVPQHQGYMYLAFDAYFSRV